MTTGRLLALSAAIGSSKGVLYDISAATNSTKGRLYRVSAAVPVPFVVTLTASDVTADPFQVITLTASATGGTVTNWSWSAPGLVLSGTGNVRTFIAPPSLSPGLYEISVTASGTGASNGDGDVTVAVFPHIEWGANDGVWSAELATQY